MESDDVPKITLVMLWIKQCNRVPSESRGAGSSGDREFRWPAFVIHSQDSVGKGFIIMTNEYCYVNRVITGTMTLHSWVTMRQYTRGSTDALQNGVGKVRQWILWFDNETASYNTFGVAHTLHEEYVAWMEGWGRGECQPYVIDLKDLHKILEIVNIWRLFK